jgi:hypothetical protein
LELMAVRKRLGKVMVAESRITRGGNMSAIGRILWLLLSWYPLFLFIVGRLAYGEDQPSLREEWEFYTSTIKSGFPRSEP